MRRSTQARRRWQRLLGRWQRSALSLSAFCRGQAVSYTQAVRWRRRLASEPVPATPLTLIPVLAPAVRRAGLVVRLPSGLGIEVEAGFDAELLQALVRILEPSRPC